MIIDKNNKPHFYSIANKMIANYWNHQMHYELAAVVDYKTRFKTYQRMQSRLLITRLISSIEHSLKLKSKP